MINYKLQLSLSSVKNAVLGKSAYYLTQLKINR